MNTDEREFIAYAESQMRHVQPESEKAPLWFRVTLIATASAVGWGLAAFTVYCVVVAGRHVLRGLGVLS
jgi:hypothetical protein